jgi:hypothetical protein
MEIIPTLHRYSFKWTFRMPEIDVDDGVGLRPKGEDFPPKDISLRLPQCLE